MSSNSFQSPFDVVRSANSSTYNYINPVRRDVVSTGIVGSMTTIRFRTDDDGPWYGVLFLSPPFHLKIFQT
jgi:hypothetical protein